MSAQEEDEVIARRRVTCSCGWTREFLQRWAAESAAKLHPKLGEPGTEHTVRIEVPPDQTCRQPEPPLA
jgi:hypothetical protein